LTIQRLERGAPPSSSSCLFCQLRLLPRDPRAARDPCDRAFLLLPPAIDRTKEPLMTIKIFPNEKGTPAGKLADAEVHFAEGPLRGLKLIGFAVWERKSGSGRNVTFPARQYSVNGERRSYALLRPIESAPAQDQIRDLILQAYAEYVADAAVAS
jgi:hypothetical protein